jgi:hypothetical protein
VSDVYEYVAGLGKTGMSTSDFHKHMAQGAFKAQWASMNKGLMSIFLGNQPMFQYKLPAKLVPWQQEALRCILSKPDDRKCYFFVDVDGGAGKTALAKAAYNQVAGDCFMATACEKAGNMFYAYSGQSIVVIDMPRAADKGMWRASMLCAEKFKDGNITKEKYESGVMNFEVPMVVFFSNEHPPEGMLSVDRVVVATIVRPTSLAAGRGPVATNDRSLFKLRWEAEGAVITPQFTPVTLEAPAPIGVPEDWEEVDSQGEPTEAAKAAINRRMEEEGAAGQPPSAKRFRAESALGPGAPAEEEVCAQEL